MQPTVINSVSGTCLFFIEPTSYGSISRAVSISIYGRIPAFSIAVSFARIFTAEAPNCATVFLPKLGTRWADLTVEQDR